MISVQNMNGAGTLPTGHASPGAARYRKRWEKHIPALRCRYHQLTFEDEGERNCSFTPSKGKIHRAGKQRGFLLNGKGLFMFWIKKGKQTEPIIPGSIFFSFHAITAVYFWIIHHLVI